MESKLYQGITTEITGNCGISILPNTPEGWRSNQEYFFNQLELPTGDLSLEGLYDLNDYSSAVTAHGCIGNYGQLIGHGTLRGAVMGFVDRDPTPEEMERLKALLRRELEAGAFGMSLGLIYPPSSFCKTEELVELAKVLKEYDALLTVHMRSEGPRVFQAVDEMLEITRRSGVHLQISHLKLMGKPQWGRADELLAKIQAARDEGLTITCDQYPYTATSTSMTALLPHWAHDGGVPALIQRLKEPTQKLKDETGEEMEKAHRQRKAAAFLSIEDLSIMGKYVEKIREMGFRFAMLTWNYENEYACGAAADQAKGLTARGKEMVKVLTDQGIVMDISHLSDQGVEDLFQLTDRPVMASHSDIREVWDAPRNLQKVHLKELISRKGIIGMNFFAPFVGEKPQISDLLKHMDAVLEMGGEDCLAIGSDFDGCDGLFPAHIEGVQSMPFLREELLKHGFTEELTEKIFYKNAHRFVMENVK